MTNYRFHLLLIISLVCLGWTSTNKATALMMSEGRVESWEIGQIAQKKTSNPSETSLSTSDKANYDRYMQEGYQATQQKDYQTALKQFQKALEEHPQDIYAQQAIHNIEAYLTNQENLLSNLTSKGLWLLLGAMAIIAGIGGGLWLIINRLSNNSPETLTKELPNTENSLAEKAHRPRRGSLGVRTEQEEAENHPSIESQKSSKNPVITSAVNAEGTINSPTNITEETPFPIQATTRLPNLDIIEELLKDLQDIDPKKRRKAIWELAQKADSRAMKPLVDLMIDTDSQERSLILEALSQISLRTLKPMNQALAISLQDKNPQVRKNAIRDLTRIYDIMSQISQLLCHAIGDSDREVQETAQWALNQLNLQMPPQVGLLNSQDSESIKIEKSTIDQ